MQQNTVKEIVVYKSVLGWLTVWLWVLGDHLVRYKGNDEQEARRIAKEDADATGLPVKVLDGEPL